MRQEAGNEWDRNFEVLKGERKDAIIDQTVENGAEVMGEIYTKIERERMAKYMAQKNVERTPERKQQVEAAFGQGALVDLTDLGASVMDLEDGGSLHGDLEQDRKALEGILKGGGFYENRGFRTAFGEHFRDAKVREAYQQAAKKEYGILEFLFDEILAIGENLASSPAPKAGSARRRRRSS